MERTPKLSRTELAAIVHHVELNQDGWWDKTIHRLFLASVWLVDYSLTNSKVQEILKSEFGLDISSTQIEHIAEKLESQNLLVRLPNDKFRLPDDQRVIFDAEIAEAKNIAENAKEYFIQLVEELFENLNPNDTWTTFYSVFLTPLIQETGANAYRLIVGEKMEVDEGLINKLQSNYDAILHGQLVELVTRFLDPSNRSVRSYVSRMLHATFCVQASGIPANVIQKLNKSVDEQIQFRVFVDTNFLFSILKLHNNPSNAVATEVKDLIASLNSNLKINLYVTSMTIDEAKRSLTASKSRLAGFPAGANFNAAISQARFPGLDGRFLEARSQASGQLSLEDWFDPFLKDFVTIAQSEGIEFFDEDLDQFVTRQKVIDDIDIESKFEEKRSFRSKSYEMIQHDIILWHLVNDRRPSHVESPVDAKYWILTLDNRLIGFDQHKRKNSELVPICVHPTLLIQLLQFWVPRTVEFEEAVLGSMRLPFLFHELDAEAEQTSLRILKGISRFEGSDQIPEDTINRIMLNEGLRSKLVSEEIDYIETELIRDALLEEQIKSQEIEKKRIEKLDKQVKNQAIEKKEKDKTIKELRARVTEKDRNISKAENKHDEQEKEIQRLAKMVAWFKYGISLIIILMFSAAGGWTTVIFLSPANNLIKIYFGVIVGISSFLIIHLILEKLTKGQKTMDQLWPFRQISRFRNKLLLGVLIALFAYFVIEVIKNYEQIITN